MPESAERRAAMHATDTVVAPPLNRVAIMGSPQKSAAAETMVRLRRWLDDRVAVVFAEQTFDSSAVLAHKPDVLIVLGGDGTLITAVHGLGETQVPILGVNLGKLGYLAEFTIEQLEREGEFLFKTGLPLVRRAMLDVRHTGADGTSFRTLAVNDCVVLAGPPYRIVEVRVDVDADLVAHVRGDGLIIASSSGSTAHNLSAGGPILDPTDDSFVLTPICPHGLTYRPLVMRSNREINISATQANAGTTVVIDGQTARPYRLADKLTISRYPADFQLVRNPRHSIWHALRRKLKWGDGPQRG
ncbi:MAG: NAD(+)/NADH kinase [Phycisphaerae bacterium]